MCIISCNWVMFPDLTKTIWQPVENFCRPLRDWVQMGRYCQCEQDSQPWRCVCWCKVKYSKDKITDWEGCLSFKNVRGSVPRSKSVTVKYHNEKGEKVVEKAIDLWARIFQHEIDHLNGTVYIDRVANTKTVMTLSEFKKRILKCSIYQLSN